MGSGGATQGSDYGGARESGPAPMGRAQGIAAGAFEEWIPPRQNKSTPVNSKRRIVYLARHGETDWNAQNRWQGHTDIPLNETGRAQALSLAERLRGRRLTCVHASDLLRAQQTAGIVAAALGVPLCGTDPGFRERGFGVFEGLTKDECIARFPAEWARYSSERAMPPGAETQEAVTARMIAALDRLGQAEACALEQRAARAAGDILIVSHGSAIRFLVAHATGTLPPPLPNAALVKLVHERGRCVDAELIG